jgi:hypothetical protein
MVDGFSVADVMVCRFEEATRGDRLCRIILNG